MEYLIELELVQWFPVILIVLIVCATISGGRRPRESAAPQRFSFGRTMLVLLFLSGLAYVLAHSNR
jgi:hypothetical protein